MHRRQLTSILSLHLALLIGCDGHQSKSHESRQPEPGSTPGRAESSFVTYTDEIGREVRLPKHPVRIVSLAPNITETVFLLGAGDRLAGVTTHCQWPEAARKKPKIGDLLNPNYEIILNTKPDLVIATTAGNDRAAVLKMAGLGLPVFVTAPRSVEKIFENVLNIGRIVDRPREAEQLVVQMKQRLEEVRRRLAGLPPTRAFFMTWFDPLLAPGKNTFESDVLRQAQVQSITADIDEFYPRYSLEQIIARDPQVILAVEHNARFLTDLKKLRGWRDLHAVRAGRVYVLSEVIQHPSPRFVDGVEELARKLHPERFP